MKIKIKAADPTTYAIAIITLWNDCMGQDFPMDKRLWLQQTGGKPEERECFLAYLSEESREPSALDTLIGALLVKTHTTMRQGPGITSNISGHVSYFFVHPASQNRGVGSELLSAAESWCRCKGAATMWLGGDFHHFFPGLPLSDTASSRQSRNFFTRRGYEELGIEEDMAADLAQLDVSMSGKQSMPGGYSFGLCTPEIRKSALDFLAEAFPGRWHDEIEEAIKRGTRDSDLVLAMEDHGSRIAGFARIADSSSPLLTPALFWRSLLGPSPAALGPIGIDPTRRGKGLGTALLRYSLAELKSRGARMTVIDWTDLASFYGAFGFKPWKRYLTMRKMLAP